MSCNKTPEIEITSDDYNENISTDIELFEIGNKELENNNLDLALEKFDKIEVLYPNSSYATKSRLLNGYIYFTKGEYEKTQAIAKSFIKYYPGNKNLAYAYYLEAMTYYILIKKPEYDQKNSLEAKKIFTFILNAYPNSDYREDIILKLNIIDNSIAEQLVIVGKYYEEKSNYSAALNYYLDVYLNYNNTLIIEECLYLITNIYKKLSEKKLMEQYAAILGYNYPNSEWYLKTYNLVNEINPNVSNIKTWYLKLNPIKLIKKKKEIKKEKWYEPKKPNFKLF